MCPSLSIYLLLAHSTFNFLKNCWAVPAYRAACLKANSLTCPTQIGSDQTPVHNDTILTFVTENTCTCVFVYNGRVVYSSFLKGEEQLAFLERPSNLHLSAGSHILYPSMFDWNSLGESLGTSEGLQWPMLPQSRGHFLFLCWSCQCPFPLLEPSRGDVKYKKHTVSRKSSFFTASSSVTSFLSFLHC